MIPICLDIDFTDISRASAVFTASWACAGYSSIESSLDDLLTYSSKHEYALSRGFRTSTANTYFSLRCICDWTRLGTWKSQMWVYCWDCGSYRIVQTGDRAAIFPRHTQSVIHILYSAGSVDNFAFICVLFFCSIIIFEATFSLYSMLLFILLLFFHFNFHAMRLYKSG